MIDVALSPFHLAPGGRGRARQRAGEGGNTALFQSRAVHRCACAVGAATLTRPFGATSPVKGEVKTRVRGDTLRFSIKELSA